MELNLMNSSTQPRILYNKKHMLQTPCYKFFRCPDIEVLNNPQISCWVLYSKFYRQQVILYICLLSLFITRRNASSYFSHLSPKLIFLYLINYTKWQDPLPVFTAGFHCRFSLPVLTSCSHCWFSLPVFTASFTCNNTTLLSSYRAHSPTMHIKRGSVLYFEYFLGP